MHLAISMIGVTIGMTISRIGGILGAIISMIGVMIRYMHMTRLLWTKVYGNIDNYS